mmetsp:Transcript_33960/g.89450  ORF Transcript_33960/g.89450 Transcript_33960/m.89450 type:complete len:523 (-) Transcript_33960:266-1834(-)
MRQERETSLPAYSEVESADGGGHSSAMLSGDESGGVLNPIHDEEPESGGYMAAPAGNGMDDVDVNESLNASHHVDDFHADGRVSYLSGGDGPSRTNSINGTTQSRRVSEIEFLNQVGEGSEVRVVAVNLSNAIVGAGIIGLPSTLKLSGFWFGICLLFAMAFVSNYACGVLVGSGIALRQRSYETTALVALGKKGKMAVLFGQFIFDYGAALSYLIITADTSVEVLKRILGSNFSGMRQMCLGVLSLACMLPLSLLRDISGLEKYASLSVGVVIIVAVMILGSLLSEPPTAWNVPVFPLDGWNVFQAVGIFSFAFVCQDCVFFYYNTLSNGTASRFQNVTSLAISGSACLTAFVGICGYLKFQDETEANVLNNYSAKDTLAVIMRALYVVSMVLTYPICMFVCRQVLHQLWSELIGVDLGDIQKVSSARHVTYTCVLFFSSVAICMFVDELGFVMSITGNVAGSLLGFIIPGLISLSPAVRPGLYNAGTKVLSVDTIGPLLLVAFGSVAAVLGVVTSIPGMS